MRIKLDENLPHRLVPLLTELGLFQTEDVDAWARCVVTATPHKVRVKRPLL